MVGPSSAAATEAPEEGPQGSGAPPAVTALPDPGTGPPQAAAAELGAPRRSVAALVRGSSWTLRAPDGRGLTDGALRPTLSAGIPVFGDWNGDGIATPGVFNGGQWHLHNELDGRDRAIVVAFGGRGDTPVVGDWDGDGRSGIATFRDGTWSLRLLPTTGPADTRFVYGTRGDLPVAGDWDGDGRTGIGVVRPAHAPGFGRLLVAMWSLRNVASAGHTTARFPFGNAGDVPVVGDWDGDRDVTPGVFRAGNWYLRNQLGSGAAQARFAWGRSGDRPLAWASPRPANGRCTTAAWTEAMAAGQVAQRVIAPRALDLTPPTAADAQELRAVLLGAGRHALKGDFDRQYRSQWASPYLDLIGDSALLEWDVRRPAMSAMAVATTLRTGAYDAEVVGAPPAVAREYAVKLARSVACQHKAISPGGWGDHWQSALWAGIAGKAGWLLWDELSAQDRFYVARMVEYEANRFLTYSVPYWRDRRGVELTRGDSKSEENAWNATVLTLATAMMPRHPNYRAWQRRNVELLVSSFAAPQDLGSSTVVNGRPLSGWLNGYNANRDGTLVNHGRIHPDYMTVAAFNWNAALTYGLAGQGVPEAAYHNTELVYRALSRVSFAAPPFARPGGTIYKPGTSAIYFPQGADWGIAHPGYLNIDALATTLRTNSDTAQNGLYWQRLHAGAARARQERFTDGHSYASDAEYRYVGREEHLAQMAAEAWLAKYVDVHVPVALDRANYSDPAVVLADALVETAEPEALRPYATTP